MPVAIMSILLHITGYVIYRHFLFLGLGKSFRVYYYII